jgi:ABC-type multidrug transport system ATPase subunit
MFEIILEGVGRRFSHDWIFKNVDYHFENAQCYAILGGNGSGKSTLMQLLAAANNPSQGKITHIYKGKTLEPDCVFAHLGWAAPYITPIEDLTLTEFLTFHFSLKPLIPTYTVAQVVDILGLEKAKNRSIGLFSSGMQQRVRLAAALFVDAPLILLDEPCTNLDNNGVQWYNEMIEKLCNDRLCIVASNQPHEYNFCNQHLNIEAWR